MVSPQNPLKQQADLLDDEKRMQMVRLALENEPHIIASDYEMHLPKPSYTWNTLQALSKDYPDREFVLMMGGDNWALFDRWYHAEDILKNYQIVIYPRRITQGVRNVVLSNATDSTTFLTPCVIEAELLDISSTEIRARIKARKGIRRLVPKAVADLIQKEKLYA